MICIVYFGQFLLPEISLNDISDDFQSQFFLFWFISQKQRTIGYIHNAFQMPMRIITINHKSPFAHLVLLNSQRYRDPESHKTKPSRLA